MARCNVFRKNSALYVLFDDGVEFLFNQSLVRVRVTPGRLIYLTYDGDPEAVMLGRYNDILGRDGLVFNSHEECMEYLSREVFLTEVDAFIQDQDSLIIDYYIPIPKQVLELAIPVVMESYSLSLIDASGVVAGDYIVIKEGIYSYQAEVLDIDGNVLTMDTPLGRAYSTGAEIASRTIQLNVDGSVTPILAIFAPPSGVVLDINMIGLCISDEVAMDDAKFGGIPRLTKGIIVRKKSPYGYNTFFNAKSNGDLALRMDMIYSDRAPAGLYGFTAHKVLNGQQDNGVTLRLNGDLGEELQVVIQDDLTGLTSFKMVARGHLVRA